MVQPRGDDLYTSAQPKAGLVDLEARLRHLRAVLCSIAGLIVTISNIANTFLVASTMSTYTAILGRFVCGMPNKDELLNKDEL